MKQMLILLTGATDGIGKQTAVDLSKDGYPLILHGRNPKRGRETMGEIHTEMKNARLEYVNADFTSLLEVRNLAAEIRDKHESLQVLINNAGVIQSDRELTKDGYEMTFQVNYLAPFVLTLELLDLLYAGRPARVVNVSSQVHSSSLNFGNLQGETHYDAYDAYGRSKLALILFTRALDRRLREENISNLTVNCLHPGVIDTKLLHVAFPMGGSPPSEGSQALRHLAVDSSVKDQSGFYFTHNRPQEPAEIAKDLNIQEKLWAISEKLTGVSFTSVMERIRRPSD